MPSPISDAGGSSSEAPAINGSGPVLEYAVKMRQFPQNALLSDMLAREALTEAHIDALVVAVASFHGAAPPASASVPYGHPDEVLEPALQNLDQILALPDDARDRPDLESVRAWTQSEHLACTPAFLQRRRGGFVRECHGDLHLGNIALVNGQVTLFDRIEFNESTRWIDVMNDVAFVVNDLRERGRTDLAARFLAAYLETTGDYQGLDVLRFYLVYRAMVRAKMARLRLRQVPLPGERERLAAEYHGYIDLARRGSQRPPGAIVITHGVAGSGKTTCSQWLLERVDAVRIRTDVERKRLHDVGIGHISDSPVETGLYTTAATRRTYMRVCELACRTAADSYRVVVDGAFLLRWQRDLFREAAAGLGVAFVILDVSAPEATLRERIVERRRRGNDPSDATIDVLEHQLATQERLGADEQPFVVSWNDCI